MNCIDAILILGHRLEPGDLPSDDLIRRIDCAVEYWKSTDTPIIMPCGGITIGHSRTEAAVMKEMLMARGVPEEIIQLEDRSRITFENIRNAKALLGEGKHAALVPAIIIWNVRLMSAAGPGSMFMASAYRRPKVHTGSRNSPKRSVFTLLCAKSAKAA